MSNEIIPFGKYKGQPLERLAQDTEYLSWLRQQSWFLEKFGWIDKAIIVIQHGPAEPEETPEHNRLQARFLNRRFCWTVLTLCCPDLLCIQDKMQQEMSKLPAERVNVLKYLAAEKDRLAASIAREEKKGVCSKGWLDDLRKELASRSAEERSVLAVLRTIPSLPVPLSGKQIHRTFESGNIDVTLEVRYYHRLSDCVRRDGSEYDCDSVLASALVFVLAEAKVECKPDLGDDYPAVLRQMNRNHSDTLLVGSFQSQAIGLDDLKQFFADSGKRVFLVSEVEAALAALPEWFRGD
jgi:hypothetical protein